MATDLQIARSVTPWPITQVAESIGIPGGDVIPYGRDKAKLPLSLLQSDRQTKRRLILVTATNPTPAGEGKTTVSIGLADGIHRLGHSVCAALREPSLGPVFGIKGGAAGGGRSQVIPMEDINLHFTGDMHAVTAANNVICALVDNAIYQDTLPELDERRISIPRCMDMNERVLRNIVCGLGRPVDGIPREDHFVITAATEVMAILCLCTGFGDLKRRIGQIIVGYAADGAPVFARDIGAADASALLLKTAIMPNLVQSLEHTPVLIHGGPFGNIAHGCSSVLATRMSMAHVDYTVTEAGFGADLGAEKFLDIKCREADLWPDAVVLVTSIRSLKHHGGAELKNLTEPDVEALTRGFANLDKHIRNLTEIYNLPVTVAINHFAQDAEEEIRALNEHLDDMKIPHALNDSFAVGSAGSEELASIVLANMSEHHRPSRPYDYARTIEEKISQLASKVYGAADVSWEPTAQKKAKRAEDNGFGNLPVCVAKTQYSLSDDPSLLGAPTGFTLTVRDLQVSAGAGFLVAICGQIMRMPGLSKDPAAVHMRITGDGEISGLF